MFQDFKTKLGSKKQLTKDVWLFTFDLVEPNKLSFKAGQYMILKVGDKGLRNYSVWSSVEVQDRFELLIQLVPGGLASEYLNNLSEGDEVLFRGPAGIFTFKETNRDKIFLATGTGIAPIRSMLLSHVARSVINSEERGINWHLLWGLRKKEDVYFFEEFKKLSKDYPNFHFHVCLSQETDFDELDKNYFSKGRVTNHLTDLLSNQSKDLFDYYICGGKDVVESLRQFVKGIGVENESITFEKFV